VVEQALEVTPEPLQLTEVDDEAVGVENVSSERELEIPVVAVNQGAMAVVAMLTVCGGKAGEFLGAGDHQWW
jgi:hypothetical protein